MGKMGVYDIVGGKWSCCVMPIPKVAHSNTKLGVGEF